MQGVLVGVGAAFGEPGDHQVMGVVVLGVAVADLVEEADDVLLAAHVPFQEQESEPGRGVGGHEGRRVAAGVAGLLGARLAGPGALHGGESEQDGRVGGFGFGEPPVPDPCGGRRFLGEDDDAVAAAVPVIAGGRDQFPDLGPAPLSEGRAGGDEVTVVERGVERGAARLRARPSGGGGGGTAGSPLRRGLLEVITHSKAVPGTPSQEQIKG